MLWRALDFAENHCVGRGKLACLLSHITEIIVSAFRSVTVRGLCAREAVKEKEKVKAAIGFAAGAVTSTTYRSHRTLIFSKEIVPSTDPS